MGQQFPYRMYLSTPLFIIAENQESKLTHVGEERSREMLTPRTQKELSPIYLARTLLPMASAEQDQVLPSHHAEHLARGYSECSQLFRETHLPSCPGGTAEQGV